MHVSYVYVASVVLFRDMGFDGVDKTDRFIIMPGDVRKLHCMKHLQS